MSIISQQNWGKKGRYSIIKMSVLSNVIYLFNRISINMFSFLFFVVSWRLITLQYCSGFCHTLTWISHGYKIFYFHTEESDCKDLICVLITQSCPTLCDPMDCHPPGFSSMEFPRQEYWKWVAISFSRGSSRPRDRTQVSFINRQILYYWATWEAPGSPYSNQKVLWKFHFNHIPCPSWRFAMVSHYF